MRKAGKHAGGFHVLGNERRPARLYGGGLDQQRNKPNVMLSEAWCSRSISTAQRNPIERSATALEMLRQAQHDVRLLNILPQCPPPPSPPTPPHEHPSRRKPHQNLPQRRPAPHSAARSQLRPGGRRHLRHRRPLGLRQNHAAGPLRRPRPRHVRQRVAQRHPARYPERGRARRRAQPARGLHLPEFPAAAHPHGSRKRAGAAGAARAARGRSHGPRPARPRGPGRPRRPLPGPALGAASSSA